MANQHTRNEIRDIVELAGEKTSYDVLLFLFTARSLSKSYYPLNYQLTLDDFTNAGTDEIVDETPWSKLVNKQGGSYCSATNDAIVLMEKQVPDIKNLFDENTCYGVGEDILSVLIQRITNIDPNDISLIDLYENLYMRKDIAQGYHTPQTIVSLMASIVSIKHGSIYDPCCGSSNFLIQAANIKGIQLFGQAQDIATYKTYKIISALNGSKLNLGDEYISPLTNDQHRDKQFDCIMANPPFNVANWYTDKTIQDERWKYGVPPRSNANFAFLQHIIYHLKENGKAAVVMPNSSLTSRNKSESSIRQHIIEKGILSCIIMLPENLFISTKIPVCIWIFDNAHRSSDGVLFFDAVQLKAKSDKKLTDQDCNKIVHIFLKHAEKHEIKLTSLYAVATSEEIAKQEYILSPNLYLSRQTKKLTLQNKIIQLLASINRIPANIPNQTPLTQLNKLQEYTQDSSWHKIPLLDLYTTFGGLNKNKCAFGSGTPILDFRTILKNAFVPDNLTSTVEVSEYEKEKYNIKYGDVFINRTSESIDQLAFACVAIKNHNAVYTGFSKRLRPKVPDFVYPFYAAAYFQSAIYRQQITLVSTVFTTRASLDNHKLARLFIHIPGEEQQRYIGDMFYTIHKNLQCPMDVEQYSFWLEFEKLFIEQTISYPIVKFYGADGDFIE